MPESKTIMFEGGPCDYEFRVVAMNDDRIAVNIKKDIKADVVRAYYVKTSKKYAGIEVYTWLDLNTIKNEPDTKDGNLSNQTSSI